MQLTAAPILTSCIRCCHLPAAEYVKTLNEKTQVRPSSESHTHYTAHAPADDGQPLWSSLTPCPLLSVVVSYLALSVGSLLVLFLVWGAGAQFVTNFVGFAYPLYESFRSLHSGSSSGSLHAQQHWLTYWIVFALFALIESLTDFFLYWIPLYHLVKVAFLVWCFWPTTRGAEVIYLRVVEPMLVRYEGKIESAGRESRRAASRIINEVGSDIQQVAAEGERGSVTGTVEGEK
jgi:hypothetical protein